ncbi:MAG: hypothetical protein EA424_04305 [Planctomycetaceae bacterium]|nr:hypothetical protein [Gammaproteobacteria bacterium]TVS20377.1 MAG: hypothetical protein EA424_04305 [Planctomycetaceae bacterium]
MIQKFLVSIAAFVVALALQGCAQPFVELRSPPAPLEDFAAQYDERGCFDSWPEIVVEAPEMMAASGRHNWQGQFPARRMMVDALERVEVRSRCRGADDHPITLVVAPRLLDLRQSGVSSGRYSPYILFDLQATVIDQGGLKRADWLILLLVNWPHEPYRRPVFGMQDSMLVVMEPMHSQLTHEAMIVSMELALECLRAYEGLPPVQPARIDPARPQCLPGPAGRPGSTGRQRQRINQDAWDRFFEAVGAER